MIKLCLYLFCCRNLAVLYKVLLNSWYHEISKQRINLRITCGWHTYKYNLVYQQLKGTMKIIIPTHLILSFITVNVVLQRHRLQLQSCAMSELKIYRQVVF